MKQRILALKSRWDSLGQPQAVLFGALCGLATTLVPVYLFGKTAFLLGFLLLFPFWLNLTRRAAFTGPYFHQFFATKYGKFCVSWFFTWCFLGWMFFDLS
ncbi:MAG: hypothetical protein AAGF50_13450 [Pseudomonadota bacterium]